MSPPNGIPAHVVRQSSQSRSNSPHSHMATPEPVAQELPLAPQVPVVKQSSPPKQQTPVAAPPPPPPPPMPFLTNGPATTPPLVNGDLGMRKTIDFVLTLLTHETSFIIVLFKNYMQVQRPHFSLYAK